MSYEILVGLQVLDDFKYNEYRVAMAPILSEYGGKFGYDFKVSEVLSPVAKRDINRVFTITFNSKTDMENFFSDSEYIAVKEQYFVESVGSVNIISSYEKDA
jgi:uncharacterized protein (DUF1330 family)